MPCSDKHLCAVGLECKEVRTAFGHMRRLVIEMIMEGDKTQSNEMSRKDTPLLVKYLQEMMYEQKKEL
ncbi:hypothetical protein HNY73_008657 [Argiope bruennichi]|uniref:Uncharacterized protein n=1 Tax=Argiope bruennichi TaxID=94029 RepID=A0A8T0FC67_ARGBR|nr:hypothetical protein HNY73_008657 [Argiope bruennichi]